MSIQFEVREERSIYFAENLDDVNLTRILQKGYLLDEPSKIYYDPTRLAIDSEGRFRSLAE